MNVFLYFKMSKELNKKNLQIYSKKIENLLNLKASSSWFLFVKIFSPIGDSSCKIHNEVKHLVL